MPNSHHINEINTSDPKEHKKLPLVTFALFCYNHEGYVKEAVEGALAQTYDNLEIILSDDASTDRSFDIIKETVEGYTGKHRVILNRNEHNLGLARHHSKVFEISNGDIIVGAASDDVSCPERVETVVEEFTKGGRDIMIVHSSGWMIDETGKRMGKIGQAFAKEYPYDIPLMIKKPHTLTGATMAWRRDLMAEFGPMHEDVKNDDNALLYRAVLLGRIAYTDKCLVGRRLVPESLGTVINDQLQGHLQYYQWWSALARQVLSDLETNKKRYGKFISDAELVVARREFNYKQWQNPAGFFTVVFVALKLRSLGIIRQYILSSRCHHQTRR